MPDDEVDRLYGLPPDEFTAERDALAKRLRAEGRRDDAAAVKALAKPNLPAWAINQLVRRQRSEVERLLKAGEALRKAHQELVGGGQAGRLRSTAEAERRLVSELVDRAAPLLSEAGKPSPANLERIRSTLHAAAADDSLREQLAAGRLIRDASAVGLGPAVAAGASSGRRAPAKDARRGRDLRSARAQAQAAHKRLAAAEAEEADDRLERLEGPG